MVKKLLRQGANKTLELAGLKSYQRPQKIHCGYSVVVKNVSERNAKYTVVLPLPIETATQKIISAPQFRPEPEHTSKELAHGNRISHWTIELEPNHSATFNQYFAVQVTPSALKIDPNLSTKDYKKLSKEAKSFLKASKSLKSTKIKEISKKFTEKNLSQLIPQIYNFVTSKLRYGDPIEGLYSVEEALNLDKVDCGGFSTLFIALCQQKGIPARLVSGFWVTKNKKTPTMHAWAEFMLPDGTWLPADISTEVLRKNGRSSKFASFAKIGSDRVVLSRGCDLALEIKRRKIVTDLLQNPIVIAENKAERPHIEIEFSSKTFK